MEAARFMRASRPSKLMVRRIQLHPLVPLWHEPEFDMQKETTVPWTTSLASPSTYIYLRTSNLRWQGAPRNRSSPQTAPLLTTPAACDQLSRYPACCNMAQADCAKHVVTRPVLQSSPNSKRAHDASPVKAWGCIHAAPYMWRSESQKHSLCPPSNKHSAGEWKLQSTSWRMPAT